MCLFKSAIAIQDETHKDGFRLLSSPFTESHSDLIALHKLKDNARLTFARVEFYPNDGKDLASPEKYKLHIDEERTPEWFTFEKQDRCAEIMRVWIKAMIIEGEAELLVGGPYILAKGAKISCIKNCLITAMLGSSNVGVMLESSNVGVMLGSSNVGVMWGSSNVGEMWGSSKVGEMRESSNVGVMRGSSKVGVMWGSSNVGVMLESSKAPNDKKPDHDYRNT